MKQHNESAAWWKRSVTNFRARRKARKHMKEFQKKFVSELVHNDFLAELIIEEGNWKTGNT